VVLTCVNHASIVLESQGVRLITDPWLEGAAFNNGWTLLSPTRLRYEDFARVTHIWFSHEHPDHFAPRNLRRIPEEIRRRIKVLFHETRDKRVISVCKELHFETLELPEGKSVSLAPDFRVVCGRQDLLDSWLVVFAEGKTVLNLNDCSFPDRNDLVMVKDKVGRVDVLLSQFSYANWVGNPNDVASQKTHADRKLSEVRQQIQIFQPSWFIPFANFVYFSHAENFFMNKSANRIGDVYCYTSEKLKTPTAVLYPGDTWNIGDPRDSSSSIGNYETDFARAMASTPDQSPSVPLEKLERAAAAFLRKNWARNHRFLLSMLPSSIVHLHDLNIDVELSYRCGLRQVFGKQTDVITSSDSLMYCLTFDWGGNTLEINGRYEVPAGGNPQRFFRIFSVPQYNSAGKVFNLRFLGGKLIHRVGQALLSGSIQQR
jgi:UDP-MurNAc hydroxylase